VTVKLLCKLLFKPRKLVLTDRQAEYVQALFLGGSGPEDIARGVYSTFGRDSFQYFFVPNESETDMEPNQNGLDIDGMEMLRAAMIKLGAIKVRGGFDYYQTKHAMTVRFAKIAADAAIPKTKEA